jgi:hypothetical protein
MDVNRAVAVAAAADEPQMRRAYGSAVCNGARNSGCTADEERASGVLRLLTLALLRLPDLAVCGHVLHLVCESDEGMLLARTMGEVAVGTLRLAHRALEMHGRDVGYATGAWVDRALLVAGMVLDCQGSAEDDEPLVAPPSRTATKAAGRPARPATETGRRPAAARTGRSQRARKHPGAIPRRPARGPVSEQPPPPPPRSPEGTMLAVARRFAGAYMPY